MADRAEAYVVKRGEGRWVLNLWAGGGYTETSYPNAREAYAALDAWRHRYPSAGVILPDRRTRVGR